ncbi:unnamed protein product, partial [marine sediment metagenome]
MYIVGYVSKKVFQYTLTTAWDVSTASYSSIFKLVSDEASTPRGLAFSSDGEKMYVSNLSDLKVYQY